MTTLLSRLSYAYQATQRISDVGWFWIGYFICAVGGWVAFVDWILK